MELRQYFSLFLRWLWLIVLGTALAAGTAFLVSAAIAPVYQATTTLYISQASNAALPSGLDYTSILGSERLARTYGELLKKRPVLNEVIDAFALRDDKGSRMTPEDLVKLVNVQLVRDTQLLQVTVENTNPALAARIADKLVAVFIKQNEAMQLARYVDSKQNLEKQLATLDQETKEAQKALDAARSASGASPADRQAEINRLEYAVTAYRNSYASLLKSYEEVRLAETKTVDNVIVAEPAQQPEKPVRPNKLMNTLLAAVVGLMLAVGVVFLIEYLDDTIKTPDELAAAMGITALGAISRTPPTTKPSETLITADQPKSPVAEAYRVLRTSVQFAGVNKPLRTMLVTSAGPGEGKSTIVANLGAALAQAGKKVVLVDADLRRPILHKIFELPGTSGLTNLLLMDEVKLDGYLFETKVQNLRLMPSGPLPPNPSELLGSQRLKAVIQALGAEADFVLFDTPPILPVTDAAVLSAAVDGVMFVVDAGRVRRDVAKRAAGMLKQVGASVFGGVVNKLRADRAGGYYYYDYQYYTPDGDKKSHRRHQRETQPTPAETS
jgi:capsular exopolysaccharide synthesis family protein